MKFERPSAIYSTCAILLLNLVMLLLCLNLGLLAYGAINSDALALPTATIADDQPLAVYDLGSLAYDFDLLRQVYYFRDDQEIIWLLLETWNLERMCDEAASFREVPFHGRYVHVDPAGFRWVDPQGAWTPDPDAYNIFVFGGSTTFGYGESDNLTIPSWLQYHLRKAVGSDRIFVYNFGRGNYYSTLEKRLFKSFIEQGIVPDMAIFIDGLNEFNEWAGRFEQKQECSLEVDFGTRLSHTLTCQSDEFCLPMQRLFTRLSQTAATAQPTAAVISQDEPAKDDLETNRAVIERWLANKQAIEQQAQAAGVEVLFVIQPVPSYAYDLTHHLFVENLDALDYVVRSHYGYAVWEDMLADPSADWTGNVLNLARLGEDNDGPIYLDRVHYTSSFMDEIASAIAEHLMNELAERVIIE